MGILILAFSLRVVGVGHGLPLLVVDDEPPFVFAALKMLELKTIIPAFHNEFKNFLYYPPYLAYVLLPFFAILTGFLFFKYGSLDLLKTAVAADPSIFFLVARLITVAFGVLSMYFIYRFARNIWKTEAPALWAAFFSATSLLAISLSSVARHWTAVLFIFSLMLFFLSHPAWTARRRYGLSLCTVGIGFGVSTISAAALPLMALWFFFCERDESRWELLRKFWLPVVIVLGLFYKLPLLLYPMSMGFKAETILKIPSVLDVLTAPFVFGYRFAVSEPIFALAVFAGLWIAFRNYKRFFCLSVCFAYAYSLLFLIMFRFEARFLLPLIPLIAALAGLAFSRIRTRVSIPAAVLIVFLSARLAMLAWGGDTREQARAWVEAHILEKSHIATYGKGLRLPKTKEAFAEQAVLDASSIRGADRADESLSESTRSARRYHTLNLYALQNEKLWSGITEYLARNNYQFLSVSEDDGDDSRVKKLKKTGDTGSLMQAFSGSYTEGVRYTDGDFSGGFSALFRIRALGPNVILYTLP